MKKKILALCLVVVLAITAVTGVTLAYFTDTESATNVITMGDVSIWLAESQYHRGATGGSYLKMTNQPEPLTDADIINDSETYHEGYLQTAKLMPFDLKSSHRVQSMFEECTVAKNAYVMNTTNTDNDCFVRVRYLIPEDVAQYLDIFYTDTQFLVKNGDTYTANSTSVDAAWATADARTLNNEDKAEPMITTVNSGAANAAAQIGENNKVERTTGKYYAAEFIYAERLTPGEMTLYSPISKITLVPTVDNDIAEAITNENGQFTILVEADAIQADGFLNAVEAFAAFN